MQFLKSVMSTAENHFYFCGCDVEIFIHCIGDLDFRIKDHTILVENVETSLIFEDQIREEQEENLISWYNRKNDAQFISEWFEEDKFFNTHYLKIEFALGGFMEFCVGELHLVYPENHSLMDVFSKLLWIYGYFSGSEIWRLMRHSSGYIIDLDRKYFMRSDLEIKELVDNMILENTIITRFQEREEEFRLMEEAVKEKHHPPSWN